MSSITEHNSRESFQAIWEMIQLSRKKAVRAVNRELIELYWEIGKVISEKCIKENWGRGVVEHLSNYIREKEPGTKGFSPQNLWRMKQFFETYRSNQVLSSLVRDFHPPIYKHIRDYYSLEFLGLEKEYSELTFQKAILSNLKLNELFSEKYEMEAEM